MRLRDVDIRAALHKKVLDDHHDDPNTRVYDELALWYGSARVDVAVVNGRFHGFEIKSERDSLARLPGQIAVYGRVLDRVTLVLSAKHVAAAQTLVPEWWGLRAVRTGTRGAIHFEVLRSEQTNPAVDAVAVAAMLWTSELTEALEALGQARGVRGKSRDVMSRRLAEALPLVQLREVVRRALKARPDRALLPPGNLGLPAPTA
jgi:hypothetical protein